MDLALNNLWRLRCHKTQPTNQPTNQPDSTIYKHWKASKLGSIVAQSLRYFATIFSFIQSYKIPLNVYIDFSSKSKVILTNPSWRTLHLNTIGSFKWPVFFNRSYVKDTWFVAITSNRAFCYVYDIWLLVNIQRFFFWFINAIKFTFCGLQCFYSFPQNVNWLTPSFLKKNLPPKCPCGNQYSIKHMLRECTKLNHTRKKFYKANSMKELFKKLLSKI